MHGIIRNYYLISSTIIWGMSFAGGVAHAQSTPADDQGSEARVQLEEIVVTAERRTQNLQRAPLAISVRDGEELATEGRTSVQQILEDIPSVDWKPNTGTVANNDTSATSVTIRGIGSNGAVNGNVVSLIPSVAQYVDGVIGGLGGSYDLERVEVLRGPQGTLYGRSATAGVIEIHTKRPTLSSFGADVSGEIGNYDLRRASAGVNVPIGDKVALRVSGQHLEQDGYFSREGGAIENNDGRVKALFAPTDSLSIELGGAYQKRDFHSGGPTPQVTAAGVDFSQVAPIGNGDDEQKQYWANLDLDLGAVRLTYIPAFRTYTKSEVQYSYFGTNLVNGLNSIDRDHFHTQELRLASDGMSQLSWQSGVFYYDNDVKAAFDQTLGATTKLHLGGLEKETKNIGVFAEGTYTLTDTTRVTAGVRYDDTRLEVTQTDCNSLGHPLTCASLSGDEGKRNWYDLTYKARIEQDLTPDNLLYASVSSAFLPGDIAIVTGSGGSLEASPYEAETLTAYELGSKNRFLDNRLWLNAGIFYYNYGGYQQQIQIGSIGGVALTKVGNSKAKVRGAELEALFHPTTSDSFELNASYIDAYYVDKPSDFAAAVVQKSIPLITPVEATFSYSHTFDLSGIGSLRLKGEVSYGSAHDVGALTTAQAASPAISALVDQDAVTVGNVYVAWRGPQWLSVSGYVRNVTDEEYTTRVDPSGTSTRLNAELGAPRTIGVVVSASF